MSQDITFEPLLTLVRVSKGSVYFDQVNIKYPLGMLSHLYTLAWKTIINEFPNISTGILTADGDSFILYISE